METYRYFRDVGHIDDRKTAIAVAAAAADGTKALPSGNSGMDIVGYLARIIENQTKLVIRREIRMLQTFFIVNESHAS